MARGVADAEGRKAGFSFGTKTREESAGQSFLSCSPQRTEPSLMSKTSVNATHGA